MRKTSKTKFHCWVTAIIVVAFAVCLGQPGMASLCMAENSSNYEDESRIVMQVYQDNVLKKEYTETAFLGIGTEVHSYSAFNAYPTAQVLTDEEGVNLAAVLRDAGIDPESIEGKQTIEIVAGDGVAQLFLKEQLFAERYYFPNVRNEAGRQGKAPMASSWNDKTQVPVMISTEGRLLFGQTSPTEQTFSAFLRYLLLKKNSSKIIVSTKEGDQWNAIRETSPANGSTLKKGTEITLDRSVNTEPKTNTDRYCIYYTTDGTEPTRNSALYNYNNFNFGSSQEKLNKPVIPKEGAVTIKTKVMGYGLQDSDVSTFHYKGYQVPAAPKIREITAKKKALTLKWTSVKDAMGYKIYRTGKKNGKYKLVKTVAKGSTVSWTNKNLKKNTVYYFKIRSYKTVDGKDVDSGFSAVKYKKTK